MRHLSWLAVSAALLAGGCKSPCAGGACSSGGSLFNPPTARYSGVEQTLYRSDPCDDGECVPSGYLTLAKYWPSLDAWATKMTAKKCAKKELLRRQWETKTFLPLDYKRGYTQAFIDVANGESGDVPAVPPPRYWNTAYRSERGRKAVDCWFDGYRAGAADAAIKLHSLRHIAASQDWSTGSRRDEFAQSWLTGTCPPTPLAAPPQAPPPMIPRPLPPQQFQPAPWPNQSGMMQPQNSPPPVPHAIRPAPQSAIPWTQPRQPTLQPGPLQGQPGAVARNGATGSVGTLAPPAPAAHPAAVPGNAAPTPDTQPPAAAFGPNQAPAFPMARPPQNPSTTGLAPGYAAPTGTSPGGGLPTQLSRQRLGPPPGLFNDPPVWRTRPGHSPPPQQQ